VLTPADVRCGLFRITPAGPERAGLVCPGDELVLFVEVRAGGRPRELVVELLRGDRPRDRWRQRLEADVNLAFRLRRGEGLGSSRLTCRVMLDGREVACETALIGPGPADAQGRFASDAVLPSASPATLLAFAGELQRQLADPGHRPAEKEAPLGR
jgi:hypothetical protein